jgi:hypothetical protein
VVEENLRSSCTGFIILSELWYGSLVGSLDTTKEKRVINHGRSQK